MYLPKLKENYHTVFKHEAKEAFKRGKNGTALSKNWYFISKNCSDLCTVRKKCSSDKKNLQIKLRSLEPFIYTVKLEQFLK